MSDGSLDANGGLEDSGTHHSESAAMMREEVVSAKSSGEEGFHLCSEGGDTVMDDGWDFPVLGNPIALNIHLR
eukprot:8822484-Ditylum_brightwellii.AAC.1